MDTSLLLCGILTARAYFQHAEIQDLATKIYNRVEWPWMLNGGPTFSMGWMPQSGFLEAMGTLPRSEDDLPVGNRFADESSARRDMEGVQHLGEGSLTPQVH